MTLLSISRRHVLLTLFLLCAACCSLSAQTQGEMNAEACNAYKQIDEELNVVYKQIFREYQSESDFLEKLKKAQRAWIAYRDSHLDAVYPGGAGEYGSAFAMCRCYLLSEMTALRVAELRQWIDGEEGDICTGSRAD